MVFFKRLFGIILFRPSAYRDAAVSSSLFRESFSILLFVALTNSLVFSIVKGINWESAYRFIAPILLGWFSLSWLYVWVLGKFYKIKIPVESLLRVRGFTSIFSLLNLLTIKLGPSTGAIMLTDVFVIVSIAADILSIREAGEISTGKAAATVILPLILLGFLLLLLLFMFTLIRHFLGQ